jgi:hypothetical protein
MQLASSILDSNFPLLKHPAMVQSPDEYVAGSGLLAGVVIRGGVVAG